MLQAPLRRNREFILNTISYGLGNARIEDTNNKIKLLIRRSYGFRNIDSMLNMIYLTCSDLKIPLPNRPEEKVIAVLLLTSYPHLCLKRIFLFLF